MSSPFSKDKDVDAPPRERRSTLRTSVSDMSTEPGSGSEVDSCDMEASAREVQSNSTSSSRGSSLGWLRDTLLGKRSTAAVAAKTSSSSHASSSCPSGSSSEELLSSATVQQQRPKKVPPPKVQQRQAGKQQPVVLVPSPNSWAAVQQQQRRLRGGADQEHHRFLSSQEYGRKVRGILNKLTVERFEVLYEQLAGSGAETPQHVVVLVREIFEKAITQHSFIPMYSDLCNRLEGDERIATAVKAGAMNSSMSFRRILLTQCQNSFEEMLTGSSEWGTEFKDGEEGEEARLRSKSRALGNIKLIGRLLTEGMLASKLLITLAHELLDNCDGCTDALECLSVLLTTTGPTFDGHERFRRTVRRGLLPPKRLFFRAS
jgi:hypothetical protein